MHYTKGRVFTLSRARWASWVLCAGLAVDILSAQVAHAQISPGGGGLNPGMGPSQPAADDKKQGVAEAAPKTPGLLPTTPALPAPKGRRKRWKLFELDGYYRMRTDWMKNFNLGFPSGGIGGTPFPSALGCAAPAADAAPCNGSLSSANMRLRLEPTINLDEGTSVHIQADALDNLVLGSTPYDQTLASGSYSATSAPPLGAFGNGNQGAPSQGVNSDRPSIQIKRAWGEVALPLGVLKFGRMPNHWGMGILYNGGGVDPINGGYDYDADYGDTVDRASFSLLIPGTNLRAMIASDWQMTRLVSNQTSAGKGHEGHPFDLDDSDDINSWVGVISRMDSPQEFKDTVDRGEIAFNYGVYFEYKTQAWDYNLSDFKGIGSPTDAKGLEAGTGHYVPRGLKTYSPDVWAKLGVGKFTVEAELVAQLGKIDTLTDYVDSTGSPINASADIRKFGGSGRVTWRGLDGKLRLGLEGGFATGDQWDNTPQGATNIAFANPLGGPDDTTLSQFVFNRDYKVDMILWRHLVGAVTNAGYVKPFIQYDVTKSILFKVANVSSFALRPVATPGNGKMYGTEFDTDLGYQSGGLFVGVSYGVLFPFSALNHPADVGDTRFGYTDYSDPTKTDTSNAKDAETAHLIQSRIVLAF